MCPNLSQIFVKLNLKSIRKNQVIMYFDSGFNVSIKNIQSLPNLKPLLNEPKIVIQS